MKYTTGWNTPLFKQTAKGTVVMNFKCAAVLGVVAMLVGTGSAQAIRTVHACFYTDDTCSTKVSTRIRV